jgi:outer membrane protein assembly factor BamD (BamD/ComL family)
MNKFYLMGVCALSLAIGGCSLILGPNWGAQGSAETYRIKNAFSLAQEGKFTESIEAYRKIIQDNPNSAESAFAQYGMAMVYITADNQQKDYPQALAKLDEFITQYPDNMMIQDARNWRYTIKALLDVKRDNDRLNKNIERLKQLDMRQEEKRMGR